MISTLAVAEANFVNYRKVATFAEHGQHILAYSALALGIDQLFVRPALEINIPVEIVLPCEQYEEIFETAEACSEYQHLLRQCRRIHRLSYQDCTDDAYLATYARSLRHPFVHIHTRLHTTKRYSSLYADSKMRYGVLRRDLAVMKQSVYQGWELTVEQYRWQGSNRERSF